MSRAASSRPGEDVVLANGEAGTEKVRSLTLLSADIQRRNVVGLVGLTLGWRRGALDTSNPSESALTMLRLSVNVHLTTRSRKVDYARSFCFALGREVGVARPSSLTDRTVDAVAGIEGLRGFEDEPPHLAVAPAPDVEERPAREAAPNVTPLTVAPPSPGVEPAPEPGVEAIAPASDVATPRADSPVEPARAPAPDVAPRPEAAPAETARAAPAAPSPPARDERPTEAGWYPDPGRHAELRFWDGHRWTAHVSGDGRMWLSPLDRRDGPGL